MATLGTILEFNKVITEATGKDFSDGNLVTEHEEIYLPGPYPKELDEKYLERGEDEITLKGTEAIWSEEWSCWRIYT